VLVAKEKACVATVATLRTVDNGLYIQTCLECLHVTIEEIKRHHSSDPGMFLDMSCSPVFFFSYFIRSFYESSVSK